MSVDPAVQLGAAAQGKNGQILDAFGHLNLVED